MKSLTPRELPRGQFLSGCLLPGFVLGPLPSAWRNRLEHVPGELLKKDFNCTPKCPRPSSPPPPTPALLRYPGEIGSNNNPRQCLLSSYSVPGTILDILRELF